MNNKRTNPEAPSVLPVAGLLLVTIIAIAFSSPLAIVFAIVAGAMSARRAMPGGLALSRRDLIEAVRDDSMRVIAGVATALTLLRLSELVGEMPFLAGTAQDLSNIVAPIVLFTFVKKVLLRAGLVRRARAGLADDFAEDLCDAIGGKRDHLFARGVMLQPYLDGGAALVGVPTDLRRAAAMSPDAVNDRLAESRPELMLSRDTQASSRSIDFVPIDALEEQRRAQLRQSGGLIAGEVGGAAPATGGDNRPDRLVISEDDLR